MLFYSLLKFVRTNCLIILTKSPLRSGKGFGYLNIVLRITCWGCISRCHFNGVFRCYILYASFFFFKFLFDFNVLLRFCDCRCEVQFKCTLIRYKVNVIYLWFFFFSYCPSTQLSRIADGVEKFPII